MSDPSMSDSSPTPPPAPEKSGVWEDFIDVFYAPSQVFARRESGNALIPILVVTLVIGGLFLANRGVLQPVIDAEFDRARELMMRKNPQMDAASVDRARGMMEKVGNIGAFFGPPIAIIILAFISWIASKLVGAAQTLHAAFVVAAYAYVPKVLEQVALGAQGYFIDPASVTGLNTLSLGPARFVARDAVSPALLAVLMRLDIFTIWVMVLIGIGIAVTGKIPRSKGMIGAAITWVIGTLIALVPALGQ
jgi:membrane protein, antimicrobial resistance system